MFPCKGMDNSYHALTHLYKEIREKRLGPGEELPSGYQRKALLNMVLEELQEIGGTIIVVLDEIDAIGDDDYILYELPRSNPNGVRLSIIGITNDLQFRENLDADVRSSLGEDEVKFDPYDANQLRNILSRRAEGAFRDTYFRDNIRDYEHLESEVLSSDALPLAAALGAQDTGDAREAIRLFFRAARFADDDGETTVTEAHVRAARDFLEQKAVESGIQTLPQQKMLALMSTTWHISKGESSVATTPIYTQYKKMCDVEDIEPLSNRRFRDRLNDLSDSNILTKSVVEVGAKRTSMGWQWMSPPLLKTSHRRMSDMARLQRSFESKSKWGISRRSLCRLSTIILRFSSAILRSRGQIILETTRFSVGASVSTVDSVFTSGWLC